MTKYTVHPNDISVARKLVNTDKENLIRLDFNNNWFVFESEESFEDIRTRFLGVATIGVCN